MNKAVLISIQPKWCELIASGKKTVEVRKSKPTVETPFKCYIYQTKGFEVGEKYGFRTWARGGKVIGEFVCNEIDEFMVFKNGAVQCWNYYDLEKSCLTYEEIATYIGRDNIGYAWHISELKIYDKPKELSEFKKPLEKDYWDWEKGITRPPQSWCYVAEV